MAVVPIGNAVLSGPNGSPPPPPPLRATGTGLTKQTASTAPTLKPPVPVTPAPTTPGVPPRPGGTGTLPPSSGGSPLPLPIAGGGPLPPGVGPMPVSRPPSSQGTPDDPYAFMGGNGGTNPAYAAWLQTQGLAPTTRMDQGSLSAFGGFEGGNNPMSWDTRGAGRMEGGGQSNATSPASPFDWGTAWSTGPGSGLVVPPGVGGVQPIGGHGLRGVTPSTNPVALNPNNVGLLGMLNALQQAKLTGQMLPAGASIPWTFGS